MRATERLRPKSSPRRNARRLATAIDALAVIYGALIALGISAAVWLAVDEGRLVEPIPAQLTRSMTAEQEREVIAKRGETPWIFEAVTGLPEPLWGKAHWGQNEVKLAVHIRDLPLYSFLWYLRGCIGIALTYIGYRTIRTVTAGFASPYTFTDRGARWVRRLGVAGMISFCAFFVLDGVLHALASAHIETLFSRSTRIRPAAMETQVELLIAFPLFLFLWLLGGAMHRAAAFEQQVRETI